MKPSLGRMPFGKYKGKLLTEIAEDSPQYLSWLLELDWVKSGLRKNISLALGLGRTVESSSRPLQLIIEKVQEALLARGWSKGETEQMIRRLMEASQNGKR